MHLEPQIQPLSYKHRKHFFWFLVLVFIITLPSLIFYSTGYRLNFDNDETSITTTGGVYITTDNLEVDVYLDEEQVERPRLFRSAYYIQNIDAGLHRIVVQRSDLYTWVKELPIDSHIVVEASAFNMPVIPHLRPITEFVDTDGAPVYFVASTTIDIFSKATTTIEYIIATSSATSTYEVNEEYVYITSLFSTTSTSTPSVFKRLLDEVDRFRFATTSVQSLPTSSTTSEPVVTNGNIQLVDREGELYAIWNGTVNNIPYYFCITDTAPTTTAQRYGQHVADQVERMKISTTTPILVDGNRICRSEIKLDRSRQDVFYYDFFPGSSDLVLLQLEDGLYVTEIDDRAWQNTQLLYPGKNLRIIIENNAIFVFTDKKYFEIITEIEPN